MKHGIKDIKVLYVVNAKMPNERANGVQIAHTCEGIGAAKVDLTLVTRYTFISESITSFFNLQNTFSHVRLPSIDIKGIPFRYPIRNFSFFLSVNIYLACMWLSSWFTRKKIIVYVRGELVLALIPLAYFMSIFFETHQIRNFERWYILALKRMCGVVVITQRLKKKFVDEYKLLPEKILVARDAVNLSVFETAKPSRDVWERCGVPVHKKIALFAGTLAIEKGVDTLAESARFLSPDIHVVFLGGTDEQVRVFRERYEHLKNISILGRVDYVQVPEYIVSADVLVLPDSADFSYSNLYTSPMKLFEYMASKKPIVASRIPSLSEVLTDDSAFLFKAGDPESLAYTLQYALEHLSESEKRAKQAYQDVMEYTWEKRTKSIVAHILERIK